MSTTRDEHGNLVYKEVETVPCSETMLKNEFYPALKSSVENSIQFNKNKLRCLKPETGHQPVVGEYDEPGSQAFSIYMTSCDTLFHPNCKSVDEVSEWLKHKFLLLVYTERRFSHETGKAIEESKMHRIPLNSISNTNYKFEIQVTHLKDLDPGILPFSSGSHADFYNINRLPDQPLIDRLPPNAFAEYYPNRF